MTTGISAWDRTTSTFRYVVPTELLWEFPCSMTAKSVQPQNTRQLLWAVGKRNYTLAHTCTARALPAAVKKKNSFHDTSALNEQAPFCLEEAICPAVDSLFAAQ